MFAGVTLSLENAGRRLVGADFMLHGDLPMGAGSPPPPRWKWR